MTYAELAADRDRLLDLLDQASEELTGGGEYSRRQLADRIDAELGIQRCAPTREFLERLAARLGPPDPVLSQEEAEAEYRRIVAPVVVDCPLERKETANV